MTLCPCIEYFLRFVAIHLFAVYAQSLVTKPSGVQHICPAFKTKISQPQPHCAVSRAAIMNRMMTDSTRINFFVSILCYQCLSLSLAWARFAVPLSLPITVFYPRSLLAEHLSSSQRVVEVFNLHCLDCFINQVRLHYLRSSHPAVSMGQIYWLIGWLAGWLIDLIDRLIIRLLNTSWATGQKHCHAEWIAVP